MTEQRRDLGYGERHDLPSRFWEPEPDEEDLKRIDEEDLKRIEEENLKRLEQEGIDEEPLPFD